MIIKRDTLHSFCVTQCNRYFSMHHFQVFIMHDYGQTPKTTYIFIIYITATWYLTLRIPQQYI